MDSKTRLVMTGNKFFVHEDTNKFFAPVCGVQMYEQMAIRQILPPYNLLLTHDINARPERYHNVFTAWKNIFPDLWARRVTILDNSLTELGNAVSEEAITTAAHLVGANVIVLPDVYEDCDATIAASDAAYQSDWASVLNEVLGKYNWSFMIIPQGKTLQEFTKCAEFFASDTRFQKIGWWGIPRNLQWNHGSRRFGLDMCSMLNPDRNIHMLGFSNDVRDDLLLAREYNVRGIDSAVPLRYDGMFNLSLGDIGKRPPNWLEEAPLTEMVIRNISYVQRLINN